MPQIIERYSIHNADLHMYLSVLNLLKTSKSKDEFHEKFKILNRNKGLGNFSIVKSVIKGKKNKEQIKKALISQIRKKSAIIKRIETSHPEIGMAYNISMSFMLSRYEV